MTVLESRPLPALPDHPGVAGDPQSPLPSRWKWTGDDLIRLGEAGLLPADGRFELLDGEIYQLRPPGPLHSVLVGGIRELLATLARLRESHVREEKPIRLNAHYDPQPDVSIVRGQKRNYRTRFPEPGDVWLVVEVCDSSLDHDLEFKVPAYAEAGIAECWLVNVPEQQVQVYREPSAEGYRLRRIYCTGEAIEPLAFPGSPIAVADLLDSPEADDVSPSSDES